MKTKLNVSPRDGPTSHLNILGTDFFSEGDLVLSVDDNSSEVKIDKRVPDFVYGFNGHGEL